MGAIRTQYGQHFAYLYEMIWEKFSSNAAPKIYDYVKTRNLKRIKVIDLCCGTGAFSLFMAKKGYDVLGIDISEYMLEIAKKKMVHNNIKNIEFMCADVSSFKTHNKFNIAVSLFDSLNHISTIEQLEGCFQSVYLSASDGAIFVFDLNTQCGIKKWDRLVVKEHEKYLLITKGLYNDGEKRAIIRYSGFITQTDDLYVRFEETIYNYWYPLEQIHETLKKIGWKNIHFRSTQSFENLRGFPENRPRVFVVAEKI